MSLPSRPGQSLIEVILALAFLATITVSLVQLTAASSSGGQAGRAYTVAAFLAVQGLEAVRSMAAADFSALADGDHGLTDSPGRYAFSGTFDVTGAYTRTITVQTATRDGDSTLRDDAAGTADPSTKKITAAVRWADPTSRRTRQVVLSTFLTNWR